jgi:hypothetical protein
VLDAAAAKGSAGSDSLWPVFLDASHLTAVVTSKKAPHPQVRVCVGGGGGAARSTPMVEADEVLVMFVLGLHICVGRAVSQTLQTFGSTKGFAHRAQQ